MAAARRRVGIVQRWGPGRPFTRRFLLDAEGASTRGAGSAVQRVVVNAARMRCRIGLLSLSIMWQTAHEHQLQRIRLLPVITGAKLDVSQLWLISARVGVPWDSDLARGIAWGQGASLVGF